MIFQIVNIKQQKQLLVEVEVKVKYYINFDEILNPLSPNNAKSKGWFYEKKDDVLLIVLNVEYANFKALKILYTTKL